MKPFHWYGIYVARESITTQERAAFFVYDPSTKDGPGTNYVQDLQQRTDAIPGNPRNGATSNFYIDIGGDSQISVPCNCEITNFNFLYQRDFSNNLGTILELMKQPPSISSFSLHDN